MGDDSNDTLLPFTRRLLGLRRDREDSGVEPFLTLRYRRRGRSISRIVAIPLAHSRDGTAPALELYFALG
jgi:hypothetical protein